MKSQNRAWLIFSILLLSWGTLPASPFAYLADMLAEWGGFLVGPSAMPGPWQAVLVYVLLGLVLLTLLLLGRSRNRLYIAGICALAEMVHHLIYCIRTERVYPVSLAIAIGLALALLFLLIKPKSPGLWLSDAFILAIPVWLVYDGPVFALGRLLSRQGKLLPPFLPLPENAWLEKLDGTWGVPMSVWALLPLLLAVLPLVFFAGNRQKG
ncbi:MAG TPA: hypothetical protein DD640_06490 [Clostridiales bacterium]|nr:hypothetical protein [Clostridiales bacterium]